MANVRVAVRVRPLSRRELKEGGRIIMEVDDKVAKIRNLKVDSRAESFGDSREKVVAFGFDYCYWSVSPEDPGYASQEMVFQDLGTEVLSGATKGYNICLFAYGQTGSGKTYTMLGTPASVGLTPRICEGLFIREEDCASLPSSCRIKVSFLEIYNERVRDLLKKSHQKKSYTLRVREHPEMGPYVQGLSQHVVTSYQQVIKLLEEGIANRITAATHVHEASSRSHAIFTIHYTQAILQNNLSSEISSKINLVDLAGSERADPSSCKDRITEGANINKSLVTLGIVISTLAQNSQVFSSCQSLSSTASNGGNSGIRSVTSGASSGGGPSRRQSYIPYRDSVLTWLLKDSLGGNSKTIMVATVSPAHTSYSETMSTLRYASNAKNIINKPRVNEDANVKLIRELREEIERLKAMLLSFELRNFSSLNDEKDENLKEIVLQNELKIDQLTKDWAQRWNDWQALMEHYSVDINKRRAGVVIDSSLPHLMALEDDVLSTRVVLYHLKEGTTKIGRIDSDQEQDIVLQGQWIERDHCTITSTCGVVILRPTQGARCTVNGREVIASCRLTQGAVITLGKAQKFRFNHPAEAAVLRQQRQVGVAVGSSGSLEWLDLVGDVTASRHTSHCLCPVLWKERRVPEKQSNKDHQPSRNGVKSHRVQIKQQQCFVEDLRHQILEGQIKAQKELELDRAHLSWQLRDNQQWLLREETWLASLREQQQEDCGEEKVLEAPVAPDAWLPTAPETLLPPLVRSQKRVAQLQLLRRHTLRAAERNFRRQKVSSQLERIIKKRRLLEAQRRLEQLRAPYWLQDESTVESPSQAPRSNAPVPGPQHRSRRTTCNPLSLQKLCSQYLPQLHSDFLNQDPSTVSTPVPDPTHQVPEETSSADSVPQAAAYPARTGCLGRNSLYPSGWRKLNPARGALATKAASTPGTSLLLSFESVNSKEFESGSKQPCQMASQGLVTLCQSTKKLKPRDGSRTFIPTAQTGRTKGLSTSGNVQAWWQKEGRHGTYKVTKGASCHSTYPRGLKQATGRGKAAKTFRAESKPPPLSRASKKHQRVLVAKVRDITKKFSRLPHGSPLKRQLSTGDADSTASLRDSSLTVDHSREKDNNLSADTDSSYSVDSLSYVYAKGPKELLKSKNLQGKWALQEPENSESDDSQISEDSLADKGYQSPKESSGGNHPINDHGHPRTRTSASVRGFSRPSDSGLHAQTPRSFSLDSLIDAEEELKENQQEECFLGSTDEMPTETFWHLPNTTLPAVDQETTYRPGPFNHRVGVRLNTFLPISNVFYLDPQFQSHGKQPETEVEVSYSEQPSSLQGIQLTRESPLVSVDSWFSCDSKIHPSSPQGIVDSLCPSPNVHEVQTCGGERPGYWLNIEEVKPSGTILPCSSNLSQGSANPPCSSGDVYTTSASKIPTPLAWGIQRVLQPGADGIFQGREIPDTTQQDISEDSHNSGMSNMLPASDTSFTHVGNIHEKDWAALQQKYILELSHSVLEAIGRPLTAFPFLEEDSSSLAKAFDRVDTQLPVGPGLSSNLDFSYFPGHLSKVKRLRAEKEQDSLSAKLKSTSDFLSASEKEASCNGAYSADLESLTSGSYVQACTARNKIPHSIMEACEIKQDRLGDCLQSGSNPGLMTSSKEYFFQKKAYHNVTITTKSDNWPQDQAPFRKNAAIQPGQLGHNSHYSLQEGKATCQESSKEVVRRHVDACFAFPSGPELDLCSASWSPPSLQPPPLETFYITKSRDALTETALEIPAYREARVPSPPYREAWGVAHSHQVLLKTHLKNNLPVLSQSQNSKSATSQQVTTKRSTDLNTEEVTEELGKCPRHIKEGENHDSVYCFIAQNRYHLPSTSLKACEFENQVGILNKKYSLSVQKEGEQVTAQCHCTGAFDSSESEKTFLLVCDSEADGEEQTAFLPQIKVCGIHSQISPRASKTTSVDLEKDIPEEAIVSLKSRSVYHQVNNPVIMVPDESPTHKWEERNETGLLRATVLPKDIPEEFTLPGTGSTCERFHPITYSQERNIGECKIHVWSQEMINSKEESLGEKQNKSINNAEEMARLIRSVMQLENDILEIESKQNKQLRVSRTPGISKDYVFQDLQEQERADHVLMLGSSRKHLAFKDQPNFPRQMDDRIFSDSETEEMEGNSITSNDDQVKKTVQSPFKSRECTQNKPSVREHSHPAGVHRPSRDTCDSLGKQTAFRESTEMSLPPRKTKALVRALPLQPRVQKSSEEDGELLEAPANPKEQAWGLESLKEPETLKSFQESEIAEHSGSSESESTETQGGDEETAVETGGTLPELKTMVSSTQKLPGPSQHCKGTFFSQETVSPFLNQIAPPHQELSSSLPLHSPRLPSSSLNISDSKGMSAFDHMLDTTVLKTYRSPLATGLGHQDQSSETRNSSSHRNGREDTSMAHAAWFGTLTPMVMASDGQSVTSESILLETENGITVSTSPQDQRGDPRITSMSLTTQGSLDSEAEATVQKEIRTSSWNRISRQTEKRVSFLLKEDDDQGEEASQNAEKESEDQQPASSAYLTPASLPRVSDPEPRIPDSSVHASICLAILEEIRQAKAQRRQLRDLVAGGTVLPYYEISLEHESVSGAAGGPQWQRDKLGSDSTRNKGGTQGLLVASPSAASTCILANERKEQAMPLCMDSLQPLPNPETDREPRHHSLASSYAYPDLDERPRTGKASHFLEANGLSSSSEVMEKKKEALRTLSSADPLASDRFLSLPSEEQDRRVGSNKVSALSSQASCDGPGRILHGRGQLAAWETAERTSSGGQGSSPEGQEPKSLDSTCGGGSGNILVTAQEGKTVHSECQSVICNADNSASLSGLKQGHIRCSEPATGLEEGRASPKQCAVRPGALRKVELPEASTQQHIKWKNVESGLAEACETSSKNPIPTPLPDQRPGLYPNGVTEEALGLCPKETLDCLDILGSTEGSRPLGSCKREEESRTIPYPQLCNSQPTAVHTCCSHSSTWPCYRDDILRKGPSRAAPHSAYSLSVVPSRACETDETQDSLSMESHVLSAHGLEQKHVHVDLGPIDNSSLEPSAAATVSSLAQGCCSLSISDVRAQSVSHSAASGTSRSAGESEKNTAVKKARTAPEAAFQSSPTGTYSESLKTLKGIYMGENAQPSQNKREPTVGIQGPCTLNLSGGSVENEVVEAQYRHLENTIRRLSEKTQLSTETRSHSCLDPQAKFVARLKHTSHPQVDSSWEEEEQQTDQASERSGECYAQGKSPLPSGIGNLDGCQIRDAEQEEVAVTKSPVSQTIVRNFEDPDSLPLMQTETPLPAAQRPGQLCSGREQLAPRHKCSLPVIAVFSGPKHARTSPRPQFSVISSSRSLQELNLSVEPPSPSDEDAQGPNRLWSPHLRGHSSEKPMAVTSPKTENCSQKASSNLNNSPDDHTLLKPVTPPYPTSSTVSCMPVPDVMTNRMPGTLEQAHQKNTEKLSMQDRPENWYSQVDKGMLQVGSSDINPYALPWCPQGPVSIGWKQYVFGSAVDVACSQKPHDLIPSNMAQCSSMDNGLEDKKFPFHSYLSTCAQTRDLSSIRSSIENARSSKEGWEVWSSSFALGNSHALTGSAGVDPTSDPDSSPQLRGPTDEADCLRSELSLTGGSSAVPVDEIVLLYPSKTGCPVRQARMNTFEQSTQTLSNRPHWSCTDISTLPDTNAVSASELASWTNMHNLSLHLSQLLHSTSELLGSLSQPSVAQKDQNTKSDSPNEAPQVLMMDGATQTTVDEGIQTDLASPPVPLQTPKVKPQGVDVILEVLDSGIMTIAQEMGDVPRSFKKKEAEKTAESPDLHEESSHCKLQSPSVPSSHLMLQKAPLGQNLPLSPPVSPNASLPPSSQLQEPCMVVDSPSIPHSLGPFSASEFTQEPSVQKNQGPASALLVDRASSPILTFSPSTPELSNPLSCLALSVPSAHPLEGCQKLDICPDLAVDTQRPPENNFQAIDESDDSQKAESLGKEDKIPLERTSEELFLDSSFLCSRHQSSGLQVSFLGQPPQQLQPKSTTGDQSRLPHRSPRLDDSFVSEKVASLEHPASSKEPSQWQGKPASGTECSAFLESQSTLDLSSSWKDLQPLSPCPVSVVTDPTGVQGSASGPPQACQSMGLLCPGSCMCVVPDPQHHSLRHLPEHKKSNNWCGVQDDSCGGLHISEDLEDSSDSSSVGQTHRLPQPSDDHSQNPEWSQMEQIPLQVGIQNPSLSVELSEAKLHHGFGETDALLQVLQSGTGKALAPEEPAVSTWQELYARQKKAIETHRRERIERLKNFRWTRSLSLQKQVGFLPNKDLPTWELDLPSKRREYLQQLRKEVVETTRSPEPASRSAHTPSEIELMLRDYQRAREEAKVEIAQARDRLRERTEQEKLRIRQQIIAQLLREEEKLQTLANSSSLCTSSNGSLSSGLTSGYNSSPAFSSHFRSSEGVEDSNIPDSQDTWTGDWRGHSAVRNSQLYLTGSAWKNLAYSCRASLGSGCCSPSSLSSLGTCFSSSYQDLAKHIINTSMANVMAACSDNLHNLFSRQATAGWNYQGEEQEVQLYYKEFSSTRHGFLGAGVVSQPLSHVWAAVSDPTLWPLYHKPIQTARLHQRVTNSISLVYLVCDTTLCALKQLRDFCCVCVEAKEGHLSVMAAQSVYDTSMPRPSRKMVRGEILPSAWVLQPVTMEGKEITRVIFLAQVELGAPGFPPHLLSSFIKQQPLVVAKLASFLGS